LALAVLAVVALGHITDQELLEQLILVEAAEAVALLHVLVVMVVQEL
jgi:hypothetical protein